MKNQCLKICHGTHTLGRTVIRQQKRERTTELEKNLAKILEREDNFGERQRCIMDGTQAAQYCLTQQLGFSFSVNFE